MASWTSLAMGVCVSMAQLRRQTEAWAIHLTAPSAFGGTAYFGRSHTPIEGQKVS